jgi:HlyD family secretion protein
LTAGFVSTIISRMINNVRPACLGIAVALFGLTACEPKQRYPGAFQGIVEFDERVLAFEMSGRVTAVPAVRGAGVQAGDLLATLDNTLERTTHESRAAEAQAAEAELALVRAGSRPEEIQSMEARIRSGRATESLLQKNLARERDLLAKGAVAQASVDDVESRALAATAERESLEQKLRELKNGARRQDIASAEARAEAAAKTVHLEAERVSRYDLKAREAGTVLEVHVDPSEVVAAGAPVVTIADTSHPYADVFVPEGQLDGLRVGARSLVHVDATPQPFTANVENIGRRTEFTPRFLFSERERPNLVVRVRVRIDDPEQRLHAGVPAFVSIERGARP